MQTLIPISWKRFDELDNWRFEMLFETDAGTVCFEFKNPFKQRRQLVHIIAYFPWSAHFESVRFS